MQLLTKNSSLFGGILSRWIQGLNDAQALAALHNEGPLLILAGAGSGKTTVLVSRTGRLLEEKRVAPENLVVMTFTNKAARDLKNRVTTKLGPLGQKIWAGTFHAFGVQFLRKHYKAARLPQHFGILDSSDAAGLALELLSNFHNGSKRAYDGPALVELMSVFRSENRTTAKNDDEYEVAVEWLLPKYEKKLEQLGVLDFDSLIHRPIALIEENPEIKKIVDRSYLQVMVDEFQDTNAMQLKLVRTLTSSHDCLTVVGDDDQSIYGWRGACIRNILDFPKMFKSCKTVRLEQNYRSLSPILNLANHVIHKNEERYDKTLKATRTSETALPEMIIYESEIEEAEQTVAEIQNLINDQTPLSEIAVLYRSNSQGAPIEAELRKRKIRYEISGGTAFFDRKEVKDVLAYLRCVIRPNEISFRRILNTPPRGIGEKAFELLQTHIEKPKYSFIVASRSWKDLGVDPKAGAAIDQLWQFLERWKERLANPQSDTRTVFLEGLREIGYDDYLRRTASDKGVAERRWKMLEILADIFHRSLEQNGRGISQISDFIQSLELRDSPEEDTLPSVQLLTLHACKGLEFAHVFFLGIEDGILPHQTLGANTAEERRLFYVGITRAKERLTLSRCTQRRRHGKTVKSPPSRFIVDLPKNLMNTFERGRPLAENARKALLAELYKKLDDNPQVPS